MYSKRRVVSKGGHGKEQCSGKIWLRLPWSACNGREVVVYHIEHVVEQRTQRYISTFATRNHSRGQ